MKDPYEVLGIPKTASDDEVKAAYRELAKKFHPDNYTDNPLSDLASEKMQEINEAYDTIMTQRKNARGTSDYGGRTSGYGGQGGGNFADIRSLIVSGRLEDAQELLDGVPPEKRDAEWYFLSGSVLYRRGWFDEAYTCFSTACRMNPGNAEYRAALNQIQRQQSGQFGGYRTGGQGSECSACDVCQGLLCADCCYRCFGGSMFPC